MDQDWFLISNTTDSNPKPLEDTENEPDERPEWRWLTKH
jgi:hypothetical protein